METLVIPAIIAQTQRELDWMLDMVKGKVDRVMLDVMDGEFVANVSLDFDFEIRNELEYEAHLMVENPLDWVEKNAEKVNIAILHIETLEEVEAAIDYVKGMGLKVTLALNPETKINNVTHYLSDIEAILVMTVFPGKYGGKFLPETLEKVRSIRRIDESIPIEVDGGINPRNARLARESGANLFASGSYIFKSDDLNRAVNELKEAVMYAEP